MDFYVDVLKDKQFRKLYGAHFTPKSVVEEMCEKTLSLIDDIDFRSFRFLDIASGTGVFSYYLSKMIAHKYNVDFKDVLDNNCMMMELDGVFVSKCRQIYSNIGCHPLIIEDDVLFNKILQNMRFNIVIGNPPYIRIQNIEEPYRLKLQSTYNSCLLGASDIYYAFMQKTVSLLKPKGVAALITPSSYLRSESGAILRTGISPYVYEINEFGSEKKFGCGTYTAITYFINKQLDNTLYYNHDLGNEKIDRDILYNGKLLLNLEESSTLLKDVCDISGGIATLRDGIFIVTSDNIEEYKIELNSIVRLVKISELKNEEDFYNKKYWCIFPYKNGINNYKKFRDEDEFKNKFPNTFKYLELHKNELLKRDKGNNKGYRWFEFGRTQGLKPYSGDCIITSTMNKKPKFFKVKFDECLIRSGLVLHNFKCDIDSLLLSLNSDDMEKFMYVNGGRFSGGWRGYSKKILGMFPVSNINN